MGHLVQTLQGPNILAELQQAYLVLAKTYLRSRAGGLVNIDTADLRTLQAAVRKSEEPVMLADAKAQCTLIEAESERPSELFNQLCHMEVLLIAAAEFSAVGRQPRISAPTQQSADTDGAAIPDLGGENWFLEAYGGVDYGNNGKLAKDLRAVAHWSQASPGCQLYLAFRPSAWHRKTSLSTLEFSPIVHSCAKKHGGPFRATADGKLFAESFEVAIAEVRNITITYDALVE